MKANYLASPPLVVAYALAGTTDIDLTTEPLGTDEDGDPVTLADIWPTRKEIAELEAAIDAEMFAGSYANVFDGNPTWNAIPVAGGELFDFREESTYIQEPPFFQGLTLEPAPVADIEGARVLAVLGDSVTTDHISPAGDIALDSPAGRYLVSKGLEKKDFNSYGSRRGNDRVMVRGTFANIRLKNQMVPGVEGGVTVHVPSGERMAIYDAAERYRAEGTPLVVVAGKEYGTGSSRDWAAKGTLLLGVRAVIAESFERIHRSNLVGMGVLPLQFKPGEGVETLGLTGQETLHHPGLGELKPRQEVAVDHPASRTAPRRGPRPSSGSTRRWTSTTTATAASCRRSSGRCCGTRTDAPGGGPRRHAAATRPGAGGAMARLSFLGAIRTVTGSQYLVEAGGRRLMVDCGMFQGKKPLRLRNWEDPCEDPAGVDAVVLTHTHLDHIGRVPRLVKRGFRGPVYCTPPTVDLAEVLLLDAAHLQEEDARYFNRKGLTKHKPALPLFDATTLGRR